MKVLSLVGLGRCRNARGPADPDQPVTRRAARRVGWQVAALSAFMVLAGAILLLGYLWLDSDHHRPKHHGDDTVWIAIDPENFLEVGVVVVVGVIVFAGLGAMLFARQAVKPLEESMRRQRNFIGDASHELRTPLAVLDARIQQLQFMSQDLAPQDAAEIKPILADLRGDSQTMIEIVNDLLATVSESSKEFDPSDLRAAIKQVRSEMELLAQKSGVTLAVAEERLAKGTVLVGIPYLPLRRTLLALVDNAIRHSENRSVVTIEASTSGHWQVVRVIDQGQGITGIEPERVFERFVHGTASGDAGSPERSSHGIGLALVHDVVTRYGGSVDVERTGENGTVFRLLLPPV